MRPALPLAIALVGCSNAERVRKLEQEVRLLETQVADLEQRTETLTEKLANAKPPSQAVRKDLDPEGFDVTKPLPAGKAGQPDVLLVSVDTLRADHLGAYGYDRPTSPFIDELAAGGTVFESAWSPTSWTLPSHTTMLSGQLPVHHGIIEDHLRIADDIPLVQEAFHEAGYATSGAVATLFVSSRFGFDRGFDAFEDFGVKSKAQNNLSIVDADHVFHTTLHWAQQQEPGVPLFAFAHVYDVHYGYDAPPPWNEKFDRPPNMSDQRYKKYFHYLRAGLPSPEQMAHQVAQYDEEIAFTDAMLRELVEAWRASGRDLIVVLTADHGEEFGERGSWGHGHTLYPEQLHVPWIVHGPGVKAQRLAHRVGTEDVAPTIAGLAGLRFDARDGVSRAAEVKSGRPVAQGPAAEWAATSRFDTNRFRLHEPPYDLYVDLMQRKRELCDVAADPRCATNVFKDQREKADELFQQAMDYLGKPWKVNVSGTLRVRNGVAFRGIVRSPPGAPLTVTAGDELNIVPGDAVVDFQFDDGTTAGPWQAFGGAVPGDGCPVSYDGRFLVSARLGEKSDEEIAMLRELGYLQGDEEETDDDGASGRVDCTP